MKSSVSRFLFDIAGLFFEVFVPFVMIAVLCLALTFGLVSALMYGCAQPSCYAQWEKSGMPVHWSFWGGCQLQQADGTWVVDTAYVVLNKNVHIDDDNKNNTNHK